MAVSQDYWDVVKVDLLKVFWELFLHQVVKACTSITYISYIPIENPVIESKNY